MTTAALTPLAALAGTTPEEARAMLRGESNRHPASAGVRDGYAGLAITPDGAVSPPAAYELGLRLRALDNGGLARRSDTVPAVACTQRPHAVLSHDGTDFLLVQPDGAGAPVGTRRARCAQELATMLCQLTHPQVLAVADRRHLDLAIELVESHDSTDELARAGAMARLTQWRAALEARGVGECIDVPAVLRATYATADPEAETDVAYWARLLGVTHDKGPAVATWHLMQRLRPDMLRLTTADHAEYAEYWYALPDGTDTWQNAACAPTLSRGWQRWLHGQLIEHDPTYATQATWTRDVVPVHVRTHRPGKAHLVCADPGFVGTGDTLHLELPDGPLVVQVIEITSGEQGASVITVRAAGNSDADGLQEAATAGSTGSLRRPYASLRNVHKRVKLRRARLDDALASWWPYHPEAIPPTRDVPWDVTLEAAEAAETPGTSTARVATQALFHAWRGAAVVVVEVDKGADPAAVSLALAPLVTRAGLRVAWASPSRAHTITTGNALAALPLPSVNVLARPSDRVGNRNGYYRRPSTLAMNASYHPASRQHQATVGTVEQWMGIVASPDIDVLVVEEADRLTWGDLHQLAHVAAQLVLITTSTTSTTDNPKRERGNGATPDPHRNGCDVLTEHFREQVAAIA